jgi:UDP-N-acetyl-D-glucosamine dehydrogenase
LGYVRLGLVLPFCEMRFQVLGYGTDTRKVEPLNRGESSSNIPTPQLAALLRPREGQGQFSATHDLEGLGEADILVICVPTPLTSNRELDLQYVENTTHHIATCLRPGQMVSLESTTYPGTTEELVLPILSRNHKVG